LKSCDRPLVKHILIGTRNCNERAREEACATLIAMSLTTASVPLSMDQAGVLRVGDTRVSLDSVIFAFNEGSTPEEIAQQYTTLNLADIYAVISYYLQNHDEVVEYLQRRKAQRAELKEEVESRFDPQGIRDRLLARKRSGVTD
jgi:uncharacterized protein (DUF433 family)